MDLRLVEQAQRGDEEAFEALARATGDRCVGIAYRTLRDVDLAEDAVQSAYVSAWRDLRALRELDRFEAWLHRTLTRACYEEARKSRRHAANIRALLDGALGRKGYYGVFTANMHTDLPDHPGAKAIVAEAQRRGVPVISAAQLLE